ncbi:glycosyltransferase family 39 protein [Sphingomonas sp. BGYR3]|uniref:ArnT family glycosyltransferase n=1 Tax=Sphingomonas sp. BGYR3 TaxID=2975483 RepID=UPI0021A55A6A|nr:glycosyltransferase family 39 protein [Sphingomonas sp. BGYR3]
MLAVLLLALALAAINPTGYLGGGGDGYHYLVAARCASEHGACLPVDHWWRRWPIVLPTGLSLRLLGEGQLALAAAPLAYALAALALLTDLVRRVAGARAGIIAGSTLALTPVFTSGMTELNIDMPELAFTLLAMGCAVRLMDDRRQCWAIAAGLAVGLAIQARPTALALLPLAGLTLLRPADRRFFLPLIGAAALPSMAEAAIYGIAAGDPLLPWRLSLGHTTIPSTELLPGVDPSHSPLFNPEYIGGWRRPLGIEVHWLIDGLLNFVLHPGVSITLLGGAALALLHPGWLRASGRAECVLRLFAAMAILWFGVLTYGLAVDPKPRMFLPVAATASLFFGILSVRLWPRYRSLTVVIGALILLKGLAAVHDRAGLWDQAAAAPRWIEQTPAPLFVEARTARFLALVPAVRALPLADRGQRHGRVLLIGERGCAAAATAAGFGDWRVERSWLQQRQPGGAIGWLRQRHLFVAPPPVYAMCVLSAGPAVSPRR